MMQEFEVINKFFKQQLNSSTPNAKHIKVGIGDDAAVISPPPHHDLVISTDTLVSGVHFPLQTTAFDIGFKSLAVSLSDMAAMGAEPAAALLALTIPSGEADWIKHFAEGFFYLADQYQLPLIGGDTTQGPLTITTIVYGWVPAGQAICRHKAAIGDNIYVTGSLGDAGFAIQHITEPVSNLTTRLNRPEPRVALGVALRPIISAAIDVSDGLAADLQKLLVASTVAGTIEIDSLPLSETLRSKCPLPIAQQLALSAGDDYELCFTAAPNCSDVIQKMAQTCQCPITLIGRVHAGAGLKIQDLAGKAISITNPGYQHFQQ